MRESSEHVTMRFRGCQKIRKGTRCIVSMFCVCVVFLPYIAVVITHV